MNPFAHDSLPQGWLSAWLAARAKGIWRRARERYRAKRNPPRVLTLQEGTAALEPEIRKGRETA